MLDALVPAAEALKEGKGLAGALRATGCPSSNCSQVMCLLPGLTPPMETWQGSTGKPSCFERTSIPPLRKTAEFHSAVP